MNLKHGVLGDLEVGHIPVPRRNHHFLTPNYFKSK